MSMNLRKGGSGMLRIDEAFQATMDYGERIAPSVLGHHGQPCCERARAWFLMMDRFFNGHNHAVPIWIRLHWEWGPSRWPLYWCEAMEAKKLDCGVLAALTMEALQQRRAEAFLCQLILRYDARTIEQWRKAWFDAGVTPDWAMGEYAYHECCAILRKSEIAVWDPSINAPVKPTARGYGGAAALRLRSNVTDPDPVFWGRLPVNVNQWLILEENRAVPGPEQVCSLEPVSAWPLVWSQPQSTPPQIIR
jgi:hypothetical protein